MCLTNIDIVDGIDCLQVMQHADGSERYLTVSTGGTNWGIRSTIDGKVCWIKSAAAGGICAADVKNSRSDRDNVKSWKYYAGKGPSIYYVIPDRGGGVCPIYYNIT